MTGINSITGPRRGLDSSDEGGPCESLGIKETPCGKEYPSVWMRVLR